jgi:hypothetical protein
LNGESRFVAIGTNSALVTQAVKGPRPKLRPTFLPSWRPTFICEPRTYEYNDMTTTTWRNWEKGMVRRGIV